MKASVDAFIALYHVLTCFLAGENYFCRVHFLFELFPIGDTSGISFKIARVRGRLNPIYSAISLVFEILFLDKYSLIFSIFSKVFLFCFL